MNEALFEYREPGGGAVWTINKALKSDAMYIAMFLRDVDEREIRAVSGKSVYDAVMDSFTRSEICFSVRKGRGFPLLIFGVHPFTVVGNDFCCWMLATDDLERAGSAFLRHCRMAADALSSHYHVMKNYVGVWNYRTLRWLRWCGFDVLPARRVGLHGEMMHPVEKVWKEE